MPRDFEDLRFAREEDAMAIDIQEGAIEPIRGKTEYRQTNWSKFREGRTFAEAEPAEVIDFLKSRRLETFVLPADHLHVTSDGTEFLLQVMNGGVNEYPIRRAFVLKLLKWFSMLESQIGRLGAETLASVLNDFLVLIVSGDVTVKIENAEALSITSKRYSEILDLDVLGVVEHLNVSSISRNDYFTRVYTEITSECEPVKGDVCGLGYNILNSETGFRVLSIRHFVLRYICSNGAIGGSGGPTDARIHYGQKEGMLKTFLDKEVESRSREALTLIENMRRSAEESAAKNLEIVRKRLSAVAGRHKAQALLGESGENTSRFEIANIVSAFARTLDVNRRLRLEQLAGELMLRGG